MQNSSIIDKNSKKGIHKNGERWYNPYNSLNKVVKRVTAIAMQVDIPSTTKFQVPYTSC